jgi:membrane protein DedA with SNARE-associated domain
MERVEGTFSKWGFGAIVLFALLPPPAPMVPFLIAAGAAQYSRKKFIAALAIGRGIRYSVLAFLAAIYGRAILHVFLRHGRLVLIIFCALIAVGIAAYFLFRHLSHRHGGRKSAQHA